MGKTTSSLEALGKLLSSPPGRLLHAGTDALLTDLFRGGFSRKRSRPNQNQSSLLEDRSESYVSPKRSRTCRDHLKEEPSPCVVAGNMTEESSKAAPNPSLKITQAVVKQDGQKADDAGVPTQLWAKFLYCSFLSKFTRWTEMPSRWEQSLEGFRRFGIRFWRRRLVRLYAIWRRALIPLASRSHKISKPGRSLMDMWRVTSPRQIRV